MVGSSNPDKEGLRKDLEDHDAEEKEKTEATDEEEEKPSPTSTATIASIRPGKEQG